MDFKARRDHEIILSVFLDHLHAKNSLQPYSAYIQLLTSRGCLDLPAGWMMLAHPIFKFGNSLAFEPWSHLVTWLRLHCEFVCSW